MRRFVGVLTQPQTYRNLAYLLLGLPLGTLWFALLVTGVSVAVPMVVVALLGIPMLLGMWHITRSAANLERTAASTLLRCPLASAPITSPPGNVWVRLRSMSRDPYRWREAGYLALRFPIGIATFTVAVTAVGIPVAVVAWSWPLAPVALVLLVAGFHVVNAVADACARWATTSLRLS
jgi:hypothetical protein